MTKVRWAMVGTSGFALDWLARGIKLGSNPAFLPVSTAARMVISNRTSTVYKTHWRFRAPKDVSGATRGGDATLAVIYICNAAKRSATSTYRT